MRNAARSTVTLRHTYNLVDLPIKVAGKSGTAEFGTRDSKGRLPFHSWFVGFVPKDPQARLVQQDRLAAGRPRVRLRLADEGQRRHRDRQVLHAAALRDQEGLPPPGPPQARQLLPEQLMGVIRAEPARVTDWAAKSVGAAWRAFDLQLTTYAGLLVAIGLVMAYTNSVEGGTVPLQAGTTFSRGLMWAAIAVVVFVLATAFDYHWLKTLAWPIYGLQLGLLVLTLAIGSGVGGSARWVSVGPLTFQFSEIAKILMIIVLASYLTARGGQARLAAVDRRGVPPRRSAARPGHAPAGPRDLARVRRDPRRDALDVRRQPSLAGRPRGRRRGDGPDRVDVPPARLPEGAPDRRSSTRTPTSRAPASSSTRRRSRSGRAGSSARA